MEFGVKVRIGVGGRVGGGFIRILFFWWVLCVCVCVCVCVCEGGL